MNQVPGRVILVDSSEGRAALAQRLGMQGYQVEVAEGPVQGARMALAKAPDVVVADLWMPSISGVQLCRLLRSEPATAHVPVILRGPWGHRDRFWAERAGASAYVARGRMGDLVRAIDAAMLRRGRRPSVTPPASVRADLDIRDRIAAELDQALFDSVIASEVRALAVRDDFEQLFDRFSQLLTQITSYRWVAICAEKPERFAIHSHPRLQKIAEAEARAAFERTLPITLRIEDEDPYAEEEGPPAIVEPIWFGSQIIGHIAVACRAPAHAGDRPLVQTIARELGGPLRIVTLVQESQRQARVDALTGLLNRRAFVPALEVESHRASRYQTPVSVLLMDVDHFKQVNDKFGHGMGDQVLSTMGRMLTSTVRTCDLAARWGGEEFVAMLPNTDLVGARLAAERIRELAQAMVIETEDGVRIPITVSIGVAQHAGSEGPDAMIDRADRAMYLAKTSGRNRVEVAAHPDCAVPPTADPVMHA